MEAVMRAGKLKTQATEWRATPAPKIVPVKAMTKPRHSLAVPTLMGIVNLVLLAHDLKMLIGG
jgi:hypothetical protein